MSVKSRLIEVALEEWATFGNSTRGIDEVWHIAGDESQSPYTERIADYWAAVGEPTWDGNTPQPWSAAFICWCFSEAIAREGVDVQFSGDEKHSVYIDRIRRHRGMPPALVLTSTDGAPVSAGDLIWNARGKGDR